MNLDDLFTRGGPVMYAIAGFSVFGVAVFFERLWALQRAKVLPRGFVERVTSMLRAGKADEASAVCSENPSSIARIFRVILRHQHDPIPLIKEAGEEAGRQQAAAIERFVGALGTVASVTPLLGLLGTVTGMIGVFQRVAETGVGNPLDMAAGIWEALLTTAFGLGVGIPALIGHRFLLARVDKMVLELEADSLHLVELIVALGPADDGRGDESAAPPNAA